MPEELEMDGKTVAPPSQDLDYAQGYVITITVRPEGFAVAGPSPLPQTPPAENEDEDEIPDLPTALKHVIAIAKEHPLDSDMNAHFEAGYEDR